MFVSVIININLSVLKFYLLSGKPDNPFNKKFFRVARIFKNHYIPSFRFLKTITDFVNDQILAIMKSRLHRRALNIKRLYQKISNRDNNSQGNNHDFYQIQGKT